jgi:Icc-related predicted phosphoesterase
MCVCDIVDIFFFSCLKPCSLDSPPYGHGDKILRGHLGCKDLRKRVDNVHPLLHVFGHIHESPGMCEEDGTVFVNASASIPSLAKPIIVNVERRRVI